MHKSKMAVGEALQIAVKRREAKSKDIALPTKVHLGKAMVFPVVMYGCKSWTTRKAEQ